MTFSRKMDLAGEDSNLELKLNRMSLDYSLLGIEVSINNIDKELYKLLQEDKGSSKASLINFAIYSEEEGSILKNYSAVEEITREHSCRAIIMELDRYGEDSEIRSWITAHCNLSGGKKSICCEQVAFLVQGYKPGIIRHTLFSHLDSDLPLVVWWQGELSESFRERFYANVDRLLFDSSEWKDPKIGYLKIIQAMSDTKGLAVQDLAWTRSFHMRLAFAGIVDQPEVLNHLDRIKKIEISSSINGRTSATLLVAWIVEALDLQYSKKSNSAERDSFEMLTEVGESIEININYGESIYAIKSVDVELGTTVFKLSREADKQLICQEVYNNGELTLKMHCLADSPNDVALVNDQLSRGEKNSLFRKVLPSYLDLL